MKLSDVMSASGLVGYAEAGLILFLLIFLVVAVRVFWPGRGPVYQESALIPLRDGEPSEQRAPQSEAVETHS